MENNINSVIIGEKSYEIKPLKVKYMINGFYKNYIAVKTYGILKLLSYTDGEQILINFLQATFNMPKIDEELLGKLYEEMIADLDVKTMKEIIKKTEEVNQITDDESTNIKIESEEI